MKMEGMYNLQHSHNTCQMNIDAEEGSPAIADTGERLGWNVKCFQMCITLDYHVEKTTIQQ